jgi:hypothetical protein
MDEWKPAGPTLRDEVVGLADLRWKRRRLKKFVQTKLGLSSYDISNPAFDERWGLILFTGPLRSEPETCFEQHASRWLLPDKINYLKQKFPRSNYQSTSEWAQAITTEIWSVLLPAIPEFKPAAPGAEIDEVLEQGARQWLADCRVACTVTHVSELLEYEFKQSERLDARITRQTRYCAELKAWEEMRSKT